MSGMGSAAGGVSLGNSDIMYKPSGAPQGKSMMVQSHINEQGGSLH